jgi:hypothetical protein
MDGRRQKTLPLLPPSLYESFRELLLEQLAKDSNFKAEYLAKEFESKLTGRETGSTDQVRRERAIEKWLATEERNRQTNQRLYLQDEEELLFLDPQGMPVFGPEFLRWCRSAISSLIGEEIPWDRLSGSFSGGASTSVRRGVGTISKKYQRGKDITANAVWHFLRLTNTVQPMPRDFELVEGNVMFTVPKTSEIDRCACKEPDLNMYCQKAVGDYFRRRLKTVGIDLNDQSINQRLAREGSELNNLATVDLSSASDSVTKQLVIALLPDEWSGLLMDLRSPVTVIDGSPHENEMISSMGNAFTFELESLIFWALARGCAYFTRTRGRISVYGDDIICPVGLQVSLEAALTYCGFTLNSKKSFWDGQFRESCGKHWFSGREVTPFYVKHIPVTISDWCLLLNSLRRWSVVSHEICDPDYWPIWSLFAEYVPKPLWGAKDTARRDALCAPNIRCLARVMRKQRHDRDAESKLQLGSYLMWLDTTKDRLQENPTFSPGFVFDGPEAIGRPIREFRLGTPSFPEEIGA